MKSSILNKIDGMVSSMRKALDENDGSTLKTISSSVKSGYDSVMDSFNKSEKAQTLWEDVKKLSDDFFMAVQDGDKKLSAKTLGALENKIKEYRAEKEKEEDEEQPEDKDEPKSIG